MLKHEEMIENVHRRIAQYEEEKKMKHSKFKNIISVIKPKTNKEETKRTDDGYIEVVNSSERIDTSHHMMRMVSTIAAGAVLVTGIGATGFLLRNNKPQKSADSSNNVISTEAEVTTEAAKAEPEPGRISPFGDFNKISFSFGVFQIDYSNDYGYYSSETYDRLASYINSFEWGDGTEISSNDIPNIYEYEGKGYSINWRKADIYLSVYILEDGKAYFIKDQCQPDGGVFNYITVESMVYDIDFAKFDADVKDILSTNVSDMGEKLSDRDLMEFFEGEFISAEINNDKDNKSERIFPESEATRRALEAFLRDDFMHMLKKAAPADKALGETKYTIVRYYKSSETTTRRETYFICDDGSVNLCPYELIGENSIPIPPVDFTIDYNEFESKLNEVLSGKHDAEFADKSEANKEPEKKDEKQEATQPTTEKVYDRPTNGGSSGEATQKNTEPTERSTENITAENNEPDPNLTDFYGDNYDTRRPQVVIYDNLDTDMHKEIASYKTHDNDILDAFAADKLPLMLNEMPDEDFYYYYNQEIKREYFIVRIYKNSRGNIQRDSYGIYDRGSATCLSYEYTDEYSNKLEWWPAGAENYIIDFKEFEKALQECMKNAELDK